MIFTFLYPILCLVFHPANTQASLLSHQDPQATIQLSSQLSTSLSHNLQPRVTTTFNSFLELDQAYQLGLSDQPQNHQQPGKQPEPSTRIQDPHQLSQDLIKKTSRLSRVRRQAHSPRDWLYPSYTYNSQDNRNFNNNPSYNNNPYARRRSSPSSSFGLAYRSIIPTSSSSNHYTNYYRNRNLYAGQPQQQSHLETNNNNNNNTSSKGLEGANLDLDSDKEGQSSLGSSSRNVNSNGAKNRGSFKDRSKLPDDGKDHDLTIGRQDDLHLQFPSTLLTPLSTSTTPRVSNSGDKDDLLGKRLRTEQTTSSPPRSAPATEQLSQKRLSSTLQMDPEDGDKDEEVEDDNYAYGDRDAIGIPWSPRRPKANIRRVKDDESMIVFPGSVSRSSPANSNNRPGKATDVGRIKGGSIDELDDDSYAPPPLKTLDRAALESLRRLIEARKRAESITTRRISSSEGKTNGMGTNNDNGRGMKSSLVITGPPGCAKKSGYCEEIDTYPKDFFNKILQNSLSADIFQEVFGDSSENDTASEIVGRDGLTPQDTPLCTSIEHTIYPKVARNREGNFMYVVNHDEYIQGVRVEKCVHESGECMFQEGNPPGYQSTCKQKFIYKKLLAFTPEGKAMTDTFRLPSCCVCYIRSTFLNDRINVGNGDESTTTTPASTTNNMTTIKENIAPKKSSAGIESEDGKQHGKNDTAPAHPHEDAPTTPSSSQDDEMITFPTINDEPEGANSSNSSNKTSSHSNSGAKHNGTHVEESAVDPLFEITASGPFFRTF